MIAQYIQSYLVSESIATFGTDLFVGRMPDSPDKCIALFDESGIIEGYQQDYGSDWMGCEVIVRGGQSDYLWANNKIWEIHTNLVGLNEKTWAGKRYVKLIETQSTPSQIGVDSKGRPEFTAHYLILTNELTAKHRTLLTQS